MRYHLKEHMVQVSIVLTLCHVWPEPVRAQETPRRAPYEWVTAAAKAPRLQHRTFESSAARAKVSYHVYTPAVYDTERERRFPVVYWLHGSGGQTPLALVARFDSAIGAGKIPPVLVVFPNGLVNSLWVDSKNGRVPMETVVIKELLPHIDSNFRTMATPQGRMIEGMSMGGYGAARLGFKYPNLFGSVSILSGGPLQQEFKVTEAPRAPPVAAQAVLDTVFGGDQEYFKAQSPWLLAEQNIDAVRLLKQIRLVVGDRDEVLDNNRRFANRLAELNIPHTFVILPGVPHSLPQVVNSLGEAYWDFYRKAFAPGR